MPDLLTPLEMREKLEQWVATFPEPSFVNAARSLQMQPYRLGMLLHGDTLPLSVAKRLGYRRVTRYEPLSPSQE